MLWLLGYIGWTMAFYGVWLIGEKDIRGFYINIAANTLLVADAILFGHLSVIFAMLVFTTINIINIVKWSRKPFEPCFKSGGLSRTEEEIEAAVRKVKGERQ